ncbi:tRNA 5-methoxyuridine(34)/uridine 5-oxyacetic acid(34) synthase CmoB [Aestuariibacter salexigens]|uniref:tRNA 5-methoxyuridine(34)/uridine 5-oxyacetic acid(34) synthase CmoB n=1 Tax=Aestuariibacter salexigens TaxID=226010 RepID=UPI0012EBDC50|nr:tRNA 5-methoxyuridine(34)/uridine 5-oxyacetic acid(34) synthase CmoB [Aestuariibacter salexigens]
MPQQWFQQFYARISMTPLSHWLDTLPAQLTHWQKHDVHGEFAKWQRLLAKLPSTTPSHINLTDSVTIGLEQDIEPYTQKQIKGLLQQFMPWRKGPYSIHGVEIDTEWRSDWKWQRLCNHISPLQGRTVLDVGCGSGYHMWRMLGDEADLVVGIDPTDLFLIQFQAIKHFHPHDDIHLLPVGIEQMPDLQAFDTVFSMGVLYHRKSPIDFLLKLKQQLKRGGELILETLVVNGDETTVLMAGERYAQMRNVWYLPSVKALTVWMSRCGFSNIRCVDISYTSTDEQRATEWMPNQSLQDFLDPDDPSLTIEGYPAPQRAVLIAERS